MAQITPDHIAQGNKLLQQSKRKEALDCFDQALSLNPSSAIANSRKGQILFIIGGKTEAKQYLEKGLSLDPKHPDALYDKALLADYASSIKLFDQAIKANSKLARNHGAKATSLLLLGKNEEALTCINKAIGLDSKDPDLYARKAEILYYLAKIDEALNASLEATKLDPTFANGYLCQSLAYYAKGEHKTSVEMADQAIVLNPYAAKAYNVKASALHALGDSNAALDLIDKAIGLEPEEFSYYRVKAEFLLELGKYEDSLEWFEKAIAIRPDQADLWCKKGDVFNKMNQVDKAVECFQKANQLVMSNSSSAALLGPKLMKWMKNTLNNTLNSVFSMYDSKEAEVQLSQADQKNPKVMKMVDNLKSLMTKKGEAFKALFENMGKNENEVEKLRQMIEQLNSEITAVKGELSEVKTDVKKLEDNYEDLKIELSTKMDDFMKKLELEMGKKDLTPDQIIVVKEYFNAFVETFASLYVTSQVIESGQIKLNTNNMITCTLSALLSLSPFFGSTLAAGVSCLSDLLMTADMKKNANKMLSLARDSSDLSQIVGGVAYEVIINSKKLAQILEILDKDLQEKSNAMFGKVLSLCEQLGQAKDAYLYGKLYKTAAARLGHIDANRLIEYWMNEYRSPYGINEIFVEILTAEFNEKRVEEAKPEMLASSVPVEKMPVEKANRTSCCNVF